MTRDEYFADWVKVIDYPLQVKVMTKLEKLYSQQLITPNINCVFKAFKVCPYNELKVVFLGQDPYPQKGVATGLAFGNNNTTEALLSPSLSILKEASINPSNVFTPIKFDNTLESWAKQGILLLNSALTVEVNKIGSHVMLWRPFISKLLQNLSDFNPGLIYVLFGSQAQTFKPYINKNNTVIEINHPAYYAKMNIKMDPKLFIKINKLLKDHNNQTIEWYEKNLC